MSKVILLDVASTLFMYGNGDLEVRMGCTMIKHWTNIYISNHLIEFF